MAWRITETELRQLAETDATLDVTVFIDTANALTDRVSANDANGLLNAALLKQIELYLAAHFYGMRDQYFQSTGKGRASATFQGQTGMGLDATQYGQQAKLLDITGCLAQLGKSRPQLTWLGLPPSEQTDYVDRD